MATTDQSFKVRPTLKGITKVLNDKTNIGINALYQPLTQGNSASRQQMGNNHAQQRVDPQFPDVPLILAGGEKEMGKYTCDTFMPFTAYVEYKIPYYVSMNERDIPFTLIFRNESTNEYDFLDVDNYVRNHVKFGHKVIFDPMVRSINTGDLLIKGQRLTRTTNIHEGDIHANTMNLNVLYVSDPASTEDGFRTTPEALERMKPLAMGDGICNTGSTSYPLYTYGTKELPRCFPNQGERLREDGVMFATRDYQEDWDWLLTHRSMLDKIDRVFDATYCGEPNAEVVSVDVLTAEVDVNRNKLRTNPSMFDSVRIYNERKYNYAIKLIKAYTKIKEDSSATISLGLMRKFAEAFNVAPNDQNLINLLPAYEVSRKQSLDAQKKLKKFTRTRKNAELDEWSVKITYTYRYHTGKGAKASDNHGAKGVICEITPSHEMFADEFGNIADLTVYGGAVTSRKNNDQMIEHYMCAFIRDVALDCRKMLEEGNWEGAWKHLIKAYEITAPITFESVTSVCKTPERKKQHLNATCTEGNWPHVTIHCDDSRFVEDIYMAMYTYRRPNYSKIWFTNYLGVRECTMREGLIAPKVICVLEKTAHNAMAANSARTQHHGFPTSTAAKGSSPGHIKEQAPKVFSETETRMFSNCIGAALTVAKMAHMANNQDAAESAARHLFESNNPFDVNDIVDYDKVPLGNHAAKVLIESTFHGMGSEFKGNKSIDLKHAGNNMHRR